MEKGVSKFFETSAPGGGLERSGRGNVQDRWYAGRYAHPSHVRSLSQTRRNTVTQTFGFLGTDGGWRPKLGDAVVPSDWYREKQNWRGGRHDQSRLKTMSMDGASFERLQRRKPQDKTLLNLKYAEYLLLFRRAAANLQVNMVPYQGRYSGASVDRG